MIFSSAFRSEVIAELRSEASGLDESLVLESYLQIMTIEDLSKENKLCGSLRPLNPLHGLSNSFASLF